MTKPPSPRPTSTPPAPVPAPAPAAGATNDLALTKDTLKVYGGSRCDAWNFSMIRQVADTLWINDRDPEARSRQTEAALTGLAGIAPRDELEGMMAAQLLAAHYATMECFRRAMIPEQILEGRQENLSQANKLSRTWATLLDALNKHRGKGQQKVTVEHVHVHAGGQAVVGMVEAPSRSMRSDPVAPTLQGGGCVPRWRNNPVHQPSSTTPVPLHSSLRCEAMTRSRTPCRSPAMANGRCWMHGGPSPGAPKGNTNALKHGRYTAEAVARRREVWALLRAMVRLVKEMD